MPLVISDSSTLIHLATINRLGLLKDFYAKITIPDAVWQEVVVEGAERPGVIEVRTAREKGWINIETVADQRLLRLLRRELHPGEAEVIALAVEREADLVLLDETEARQMAEVYEIPKSGVIGVLIKAKAEGKIQMLRPELDGLRHQGGFWIAEQLYQRALQAVGE
ncbi:MAG: DUF3368 domain-containing protein [Anaerolineae bacterium]